VANAAAAGAFADRPLKVNVLSSFLADFLVEALPAFSLRHNFVSTVTLGPYGGIATEILAGRAVGQDLLLVLPTHRDLAHAPQPGCSEAEADAAVTREAAAWSELWARTEGPLVQLAFDPPATRALAEADGWAPGGRLRHVRRVNDALRASAPARVALVDAEALATRLGPLWCDPRLYHLCKQPFSPDALAEVADTLASAAAGLLGRGRKALVLDLDDTVWGGVIGDVGLEGLVIGRETAEGEAFTELQEYAKALASRGVILAVCSKNQHAAAIEAFRSHPAMTLKEADIACFVCNFGDKATNIRQIARHLNLGLEALVFVDDNPVERGWIAEALPQVMVVDLPDDPAGFVQAIEACHAFPVHSLTEEDIARGQSYRAQSALVAIREAAPDLDSFLMSLEPVAIVESVGPGSCDRIAQLVAKTNQFKLNRTLVTADAVARAPDQVLAIRLKDRLQDYGVTAVAITETDGRSLRLTNWAMSCRVFSRRLENATLELLRDRAKAVGASRILLDFELSPKNGLVPSILTSLGFVEGEGGRYTLDLSEAAAGPPHHMRIVDRSHERVQA
jgi:FkbH-like protein